MTKLSKLAMLGAAFAASLPFASATPIPITQGFTVVTGATMPAPGPGASIAPSGPLVYDSGLLTLVAPTFTATAQETVLRDSTNVYCSGCLTFVVQFTNTGSSKDAIEHYAIGSFSGFLTSVGYVAGTGGLNISPTASTTDSEPVTVDETMGGILSFNFSSALFSPVVGIQPGDMSDIFFVDTNATKITSGFAGLIDGSTVNMPVAVPATAPEPSTLVLLGTGLIGAAGMLLRRRRTVTV